MIDRTWIWAEGDAPLTIVGSAVALYTLLVRCTRVVGLRSFSKMSGFDVAITVAASDRCSQAERNGPRCGPSHESRP